MKKFFPILLWWFVLSACWALYRVLPFSLPESFSEIIAKPIIWLGVTALFLWKRIIPAEVLIDLKKNYLQTKPLLFVFFAPLLFTIVYFFVVNFRLVIIPEFSLFIILSTVIINFATGITEEIVYRGVVYVWLLQRTNELTAFAIVQVLFLLAHAPILILNSASVSAALTHVFFIVLLGGVYTMFFRFTKSLYASSISHGTWNSLLYYFLLLH